MIVEVNTVEEFENEMPFANDKAIGDSIKSYVTKLPCDIYLNRKDDRGFSLTENGGYKIAKGSVASITYLTEDIPSDFDYERFYQYLLGKMRSYLDGYDVKRYENNFYCNGSTLIVNAGDSTDNSFNHTIRIIHTDLFEFGDDTYKVVKMLVRSVENYFTKN